MHNFSLIGRHLESVSRTELIFELNLAPSEERLICEFRSDSDNCYRVIVFRSQVATFVPGPEMAASHFLQVQVKSQVISLQVQVKSQVISVQVQVKSRVIWSDVKSSQVTSHLVQTQVKSQVSLSKYKSSRTLFLPLPS